MRARHLIAEAVFASMVLGSIAVPSVVLPRAQQGSGTSESGGSTQGGEGSTGSSGDSGQESGSAGGSGGSGQESGSAGGSGGSGQESGSAGGSGGSAESGSAGGSGSDGGADGGAAGGSGGSSEGGGSSGGGGPRPSGSPRPPEEFGKVIPAVGTLIEASIRNLPPFLLLACLLGLIAGTDPLPPSSLGPDVANAIAEACSRVRVKPLDVDGLFGSNVSRVDPDDLELLIRIDPGPTIVVEQRLPGHRNRNLLTLLAALILVVVAVGVGYVVGSRRRPDPGVRW